MTSCITNVTSLSMMLGGYAPHVRLAPTDIALVACSSSSSLTVIRTDRLGVVGSLISAGQCTHQQRRSPLAHQVRRLGVLCKDTLNSVHALLQILNLWTVRKAHKVMAR